VRLLLDEMFVPAIAEALRARGHDVVAVLERADLRGQDDDVVFEAAQHLGRALVTENVRDLRPIAARLASAGSVHHGLILTTNRRFPRAHPRTTGRLVVALGALLESEGAREPSSREIWL
jgi:predicted nuclease of predicted toxin-antitoxin system